MFDRAAVKSKRTFFLKMASKGGTRESAGLSQNYFFEKNEVNPLGLLFSRSAANWCTTL